jgi:1-deoxy-D-xylulose-5-phosphate synthase
MLHRLPGIGYPDDRGRPGLEEAVRQIFTPGSLFEELGSRYVGPVNGHSVPALIEALEQAKKIDAPVLVHAITQKGKGYKYAEDEPVEYHGPSPFDPEIGIQKGKRGAPSLGLRQGVIKLAEHALASSRSPLRCRTAPAWSLSRRSFPIDFSTPASPSSTR